MRSPQPSEVLKPRSGILEFLPAVFLAGAILLATFSAYPDFYALTAKKDEYAQVVKEKSEKSATLASLNAFKTQSAAPVFAADLARYASPFREDSVLSSLFSGPVGVLPLSIGIDKGSKMPNGLSQGTVDLTLRVTSQSMLMRYFEYLTGTTGSKRYVIKSVSFPFDSSSPQSSGFQVSVNLGFSHYSPR